MRNDNLPIEERVKNGSELLDEKYPGWEWQVDTCDLKGNGIQNPERCILTQLYGDFIHGTSLLFGHIGQCHINGFSAFPEEDSEITDEWIKAIKVRRNERV